MSDFSEHGSEQHLEYSEALLQLMANTKAMMLATLNEQQLPDASLAPYIYHEQAFWIFVSRLSKHTNNLLQRPNASVLIRSEKHSANPFVTPRASIDCVVQEVLENRDAILDIMIESLGETVSLLRQLGDFHLIKLSPVSGQYIAGFGRAFAIDFEQMHLQHINPSKSLD